MVEGNFKESGDWKSCKIINKHADGSFDVEYSGDFIEWKVPASRLRPASPPGDGEEKKRHRHRHRRRGGEGEAAEGAADGEKRHHRHRRHRRHRSKDKEREGSKAKSGDEEKKRW